MHCVYILLYIMPFYMQHKPPEKKITTEDRKCEWNEIKLMFIILQDFTKLCPRLKQ